MRMLRLLVLTVAALVVLVGSASSQIPDTTAPTVDSATLTPPPPSGTNNWNRNALTLELTASDDVAVQKFQYSLNNGATYTDVPVTPGPSVSASILIDLEGNTNVRYRAVDTSGNSSLGTSANTSLNQAAAAGATAIRLQSTNGRSAGDRLVIGSGATQETVWIDNIVSPNPPSPNPNANLATPLVNAYAAGTPVVSTQAYQTIAARIDTVPPIASWSGIVGGHVNQLSTLIPTRSDPSPGSGGVAVLALYIDGVEIYPLPFSTSTLTAGLHALAITVGDAAGNAQTFTQTFIVTTSYADLDALITKYEADGDVPAATAAELRSLLADAQNASNAKQAKRALNTFDHVARDDLPQGYVRDVLVSDASYLLDVLNGNVPPEPPTGVSVAPADGPDPLPVPDLSPLPFDPNADFDVLVFSETTGFRHDHIPDTIWAIQQLGVLHNFYVDVYDPQLPSVSLATSPFLDLNDLMKYETVVFESTVGHNPGPLNVDVERPNVEAYMQAGGGYVGIHGAADSARGSSANQWHWYGNLVGGWFTNHPSGQNGIGLCGSCIHVEVVTEDNTHPATQHLPSTWTTIDELYNFDRAPRADVHTLLSLDEDTYQRSLNSGNAANNPLTLMNGDHPISWCQNWDGGKAYSNILGHIRSQYYDPRFMQTILGGIMVTADRVEANCSTYRETGLLIADQAAGGSITPDAAAAAAALLDSALAAYLAGDYKSAIDALKGIENLAVHPQSGNSAAREELFDQARELKEWMRTLQKLSAWHADDDDYTVDH
jgi:type 1 glutamine amidotransferase